MIRFAVIAVFASLAVGCAQMNQLVTPGISEVVISADGQPGNTPVVVTTNTPTSMTITVPNLNARGVFVPVARNGSVTTWRTSDNTTFSFENGVVVSTHGIGDDLMGADARQTFAALRGGAADWAPRIYSYINGEYQPYFTTFQCRRTGTRSETIQVAGRAVSAQRIDETCVNDERQIENTYWRNGSGTMVKSRQWVSNGAGYLEAERTN